MKKILILLLVTVLLVGCGGKEKMDYSKMELKEAMGHIAENNRLELVDVSKNPEGMDMIVVNYDLSNAKNAEDELLRRAEKVLSNIKDNDFERIMLDLQVKLLDQSGNGEYKPVMSLQFDKETLDKINWDKVDYNNLGSIADEYWEHPIINN